MTVAARPEAIGALIVEDERIAAASLERLLAAEPGIRSLGVARDGKSAVARIRHLRPDLVFMDIELPELDGFQVIERVGAADMPVTIFVTAYDQYTLRAFDVHALDYLLKPFGEDRFKVAVERARARLRLERPGASSAMSALLREPRRGGRLPIKSGGRTVFVDLDHVDYVEARGNYLRFHAGRIDIDTRETLHAIEARLRPHGFVRIHRSILVNRRHIKELRPWYTGEYIVVMASGRELTMSRGFRDRLPLLKQDI